LIEFTLSQLLATIESQDKELIESNYAYIFSLCNIEEETTSVIETNYLNLMKIHNLKVFLVESFLGLLMNGIIDINTPLDYKARDYRSELAFICEMIEIINERHLYPNQPSTLILSSKPSFDTPPCFQFNLNDTTFK
jgi:hypothetical protein